MHASQACPKYLQPETVYADLSLLRSHSPFYRNRYGPGINNFDVALHKVTKLTESKSLEFRFETFNTFNHAQFDGSSSVDGNINDATFGQVVKAAPPRISQVALKFSF